MESRKMVQKNLFPWPHYFAKKGLSSQGYGFSNSHVCVWELDYKESWAQKNWCFWTVLKTLESALNCREIQPVNPKGKSTLNIYWKTDAKAEAPILCPPDAKSQLIGKVPDAGKHGRLKEKGAAEDKMVR